MVLMTLVLCCAGPGDIANPEPLGVEELTELGMRDAQAAPLGEVPVGHCGNPLPAMILLGVLALGGIAGLVLLLI